MTDILSKLFALFVLASLFGLPILVVAWLLFPKKERKRKPDVARKVETLSESCSTTVFIAED